MNTNFFIYEKPKFVSLKNEYFFIENNKYKTLKVQIQDIIPVRKHFKNGKLVCCSINSDTSNKGKICALCSDRFKCFMKVRIMMNIKNHTGVISPGAIEIGKNDFAGLNEIIQKISPENLFAKTVKINFNSESKMKNKLIFALEK